MTALAIALLLATPLAGAVIGWRMPPRAWMGQFAACPGLVLSPLLAVVGEGAAVVAVLIWAAASG